MSANAGGNYDWCIPFIGVPVKTIVEVGSRDGMDALSLSSALNASALVFECDPTRFSEVQANIDHSGSQGVQAIELALSDQNGSVDFWACDTSMYPNPGIGSLFLVNFNNRQSHDVDAGRDVVQKRVQVQGARFDSLGLPAPDLLLLDVQGAETQVLAGFGDLLQECKFIACEAERVPSYTGGNSFRDLHRFMRRKGFKLIATTIGNGSRGARWSHFWRQILLISLQEASLTPWRFYQGVFDVLYSKECSLQADRDL